MANNNAATGDGDRTLHCLDFPDLPCSCCDSCHDDIEAGYDLMDVTTPDGRDATVCCAVYRELKKAGAR